jgi:phospholipase/carboxylesterase
MCRETSKSGTPMKGTVRAHGAPLSRRAFLIATGAGALPGCVTPRVSPPEADAVRIMARPAPPTSSTDPGEHRLELGGGRDGMLFVPPRAQTDTGAPLVVMLHGAGGSAAGMRFTFDIAKEFGVIVLAPDSRGRTWDAIHGRVGLDVAFLNAALVHVFERVAIDPHHVGIGGFSDGASYALTIGLANGDLFTHILAFSPGFIPQASRRGKPRVFISHGTQDDVLPVERASAVIVPDLEARGYDVRYREFGGPHAVPLPVAREAFQWFVGRPPATG